MTVFSNVVSLIGGQQRLAIASATTLALLAAGCGGGDERLTGAAGDRLITRGDLVAARLQSGDSCAARRAAVALRGDVERLVSGGHVRGETARELRARTSSLVQAITCTPPPAPPLLGPGDEPRDENEGDDNEDSSDD